MTTDTGSAGICRRICRRVGFDRNPMRRREDRLPSMVGAVMTLLLLIIVPVLAISLGGRIHAEEERALREQVAQLQHVEATVTEVGKTPLYAPITPARVEWRDPAGNIRTADYQASGLVETGETVKVWLDSDGNTAPPPSPSRPISKAVVTTSAVVFAVAACFGACYLLVRYSLDRRRARLWETEWATVERIWGNRGTRPDQA